MGPTKGKKKAGNGGQSGGGGTLGSRIRDAFEAMDTDHPNPPHLQKAYRKTQI
jgi:hypothetical protein